MRTSAAWLLAAAVALPAVASAQCTTTRDADDTRKTIRKNAACNDKVLQGGTCGKPVPPAPVCAGTLAVDALALGYGPNDPATAAADGSALATQRRCQKMIGKGIADYTKKLRLLIKGKTEAQAEAAARRSLDRIPSRCDVTVAQHASGIVLPAVGPQCAAAIGVPGQPVDGVALRDCLLALTRTWVGRVVPNPQPLRPNVVFFLTDDQRWDTTDGTHSPDGAPIMPGVRRELAAAGVEFDNAFMTTPLCCPSRASILTASYAHRTGVYSNGGMNGGADDFVDVSTVATWLSDAGYRTIFLGKYMNGYPNLWDPPAPFYVPPGWSEWAAFKQPHYFDYVITRNGVGFDHVEVPYGATDAEYSTDVLRELAKEFIASSTALGQPFYMQVNFKAPHGPWEPAPRHVDKFAGIPAWRPPSYNEVDVTDKPAWVQNTPPLDLQEQADLDLIRQRQLEMLQGVDEAIGGSTTYGITGIMQALRDAGIAENTIVVYFADNGWQWGEHRHQAKNKPYEESIRAPMFVYYPALTPLPRIESRMALNIDIAATVAELAGVGIPIAHDGESLVRVLDGTAPTWRTDFMTEGWPGNHVWATVREGQWKYTELPVMPGDPNTTFELELYDVLNDPYELANQASDPGQAVRIATMAGRLRQLRPNWPLDSDSTVELPEDD
ncbi:MAG TPA: sulfatase [Candidatus Binatia bacterium]|jgi:arylsulfatase A-like enzyme|nr:sulfatase [Candidatus Binatia bacterium]